MNHQIFRRFAHRAVHILSFVIASQCPYSPYGALAMDAIGSFFQDHIGESTIPTVTVTTDLPHEHPTPILSFVIAIQFPYSPHGEKKAYIYIYKYTVMLIYSKARLNIPYVALAKTPQCCGWNHTITAHV